MPPVRLGQHSAKCASASILCGGLAGCRAGACVRRSEDRGDTLKSEGREERDQEKDQEVETDRDIIVGQRTEYAAVPCFNGKR